MNMISGILACLTCFGIIQGVIYIIMGSSLLGAQNALRGQDVRDPKLQVFFQKLHTVMVVQGVIWILALVGMVLGIVFGILYVGLIAAMLGEVMKQAGTAM
jgi:hypothetical protein